MAPKWCVFQTNHVNEPVVVQNRLYFMRSIYLHWGEMWPGCVWVRRVWIVLLMKCSVQTSSDCPPVCFRWAGFCCLTGRSRFMPEKVLFRSAATKSWSSTNSRQTFSVTGEERSLRDEAAHLSKCFFKLHLDFHPPVMHCSPSAPFLSAKHHTVHTTQIKYASETALYGTLTMHFWFVCEVEQALWDQHLTCLHTLGLQCFFTVLRLPVFYAVRMVRMRRLICTVSDIGFATPAVVHSEWDRYCLSREIYLYARCAFHSLLAHALWTGYFV